MLLVVIITVASALQPPLKESTIARLCEKQFVVVENAVPSHLVESLRRDALSLRERGKFKVSKIGTRRIDSSGAVTSKAELTLSTRVSETGWLRPRPQRSLGDCLARDDLDDYVESLRVALRTVTGAPLDPFATELSYAYYPLGGYYARHVDVPSTIYYKIGRTGQYREKREFSFLIYLNDEDWDVAVDGGALRIFSPEESFVDISPSRGTLVVFRSDSVPHEVLESHRARLAVVGWFRVKGVDFGEIVAAGERLERLGYDAAAAQIYLRLASESDLSPEEKAYAWFRRAHALHDGCGDAEGAVEAYENALTHDTSSQMARDGLAMLRGEHDDLFRHNSFAVESRDWLLSIASGERESFVGLGTRRVLEIAARHAGKGLVLEFGVYLGRSLKMLSELMETNNVAEDFHGFDSFQGLPEDWMPGEPKGAYSTRGKTPDHVDATFHVGWFDETLKRFEVGDRRVALVHLDCDLYSSTKTVLDALGPKLEKGAVLVFDDFLNHPQWQSDQKRAFEEAVSHFGWTYDLLAADILTKQLVIQLT